LVSAVFLAVLITRVPNIGKSIPSDHGLRTAILLGAAVVTMFVGIVLSAWRWQQVLVVFDAPVPLRTLVGHYLAGQFVGNGTDASNSRSTCCQRHADSTIPTHAATIASPSKSVVRSGWPSGRLIPLRSGTLVNSTTRNTALTASRNATFHPARERVTAAG